MDNFYLWNVVVATTVLASLATLDYWISKKKNVEAYNVANTRTSVCILLACYASNFLLASTFIAAFSEIQKFALWQIGPGVDATFADLFSWPMLLLIVLDDFVYYVQHRVQHRIPLVWRIHQTHHSSKFYNVLIAGRISIFDLGTIIYWPVLVLLGFHPMLVLCVHAMNINYNILLHTRFVGHLGPLEYIFMTPNHHRFHHSSQPEYMGKNLGGMLIIWDRMFGTFVEERAGVPWKPEQNSLSNSNSTIEILSHGLQPLPSTLKALKSAER